MNDELFTVPQQDSPRLKWMKRYNLKTRSDQNVKVGDEDEFGNELHPWYCYIKGRETTSLTGGATEDEAITNWAIGRGVKLWNEKDFRI